MKTISELRRYDDDLEDRYDNENRPHVRPKKASKLAEALIKEMLAAKKKETGKTDTGQRSNAIDITPTKKNELTTFHESKGRSR